MLGGVNIRKMVKCLNKGVCENPTPVLRDGHGIIHKKYNPDTRENDIALVRMDKPVSFNGKFLNSFHLLLYFL